MECIQIKKDGSRCTVNAMQNSKYCVFHNPDITDEERFRIRAEARKQNSPSLTKLERGLGGEESLPEMKIEKYQDIVTMLADTINNVRAGKISQKSGSTIGYLSFVMIMAIDKAKAEAEEEKIEKLKAEGKWSPEPTYERKHYWYKDEFFLDKDGNKLVLENEDDEYIPETLEEPVVITKPRKRHRKAPSFTKVEHPEIAQSIGRGQVNDSSSRQTRRGGFSSKSNTSDKSNSSVVSDNCLNSFNIHDPEHNREVIEAFKDLVKSEENCQKDRSG